MAESDKATVSSGKGKEKISVLDDDISKNFLGSWNTSISPESDHGSMEFKFEPVKGKKKDFSFDKLDMDFSLDGEFDKIKSFKVDMGDLDFDSPPKKTSTKSKETALDFSPPKTSKKSKGTDLDFSSPPKEGSKFKERLEGDSAKSNKGKQDCFAFSFDFNELDKFDLDDVLPTRTKELNKDDENRGVKINSTDKHEDQGSKIQVVDTDAREDGALKAKAMPVKSNNSKDNSTDKHEDQGSKIQVVDTDARDDGALKAKAMPVKSNNSKDNLVACGDDLDFLPEIDLSKSSTLQGQVESNQSKTLSERENTHQRSPVVKKTCNESYEESQLQNQSAQTVQNQTKSKPAPIVSEGAITDHAQRIDKQSDQVASFFNNSYEKPKVQNQPAWSFMDKTSAFNVSEQMQTTSAGDNLGDADSKMQDLNPKVNPSLTSENEYFPVGKMTPQDGSKRLQIIPEVESEEGSQGTDGENIVPESCNALHGGMDTATVAENVLHVKGSPVADPSKLGAHAAESFSGKQQTPKEIASSRVTRFNLKPIMKDKTPASTQVLPRSNLVSLNRNAISSMHLSPSVARHSAHSARSGSMFDKRSGSFTQQAIGEGFVSENNTKTVSDQSARDHCNAMVTQMKHNLGAAILVPNDGKAADRGTTFLENEKKKEDTKSSSFQVQSSKFPDWTSKSNNQGSEELNPKISSLQSIRKLKMDTIVGKLSTLKVSKKMANLSGLKISSSPALEDKIVIAKNLDYSEMNVTTKTVQLVGSGKPQPPTPSYKAQSLAPSTKTTQLVGSGKPQPPTPSYKAESLAPSTKTTQLVGSGKPQPPTPSYKAQSLTPSIKRKIAEVSDEAPIMSHPSKRLSASQRRNFKEVSEGVAQEEVGFHKNILDCSLKSASDKQPESITFEMPDEIKFADVGVTSVMENDETIEKAEACGKELDQMCIMLRKKQEEAKELLVRALVTNNKLLLLSNPMHAPKLCQAQNLASRLMSKELPSMCVDPAM